MQGRHRPSGLRLLFSSHLRGGFQQRAVPVCGAIRQVIATHRIQNSLRLHSQEYFIFRWGSGKSFLIELIKRKFDPRVKERKGSRELIQYFEDDFTDTNWKNPETIPTNFTTFIWENNYVRLVQIDGK